MRLSGFGWVRGMNNTLRFCLFIVLFALITAGSIIYIEQPVLDTILPVTRICNAQPLEQDVNSYAPAATGGKSPVIEIFKATPMVLDTPSSTAVYTFKVKNATNVQINEAGTNIKNINNPSASTLQGTATGLPASSISPDASGNFITVLTASNNGNSVDAKLTLSFSEKLHASRLPADQTEPPENGTKPRSPQWLAQRSSPPVSTTPRSPKPGSEPNFFKCPSNCQYCLKPEEAKGGGFGQKCSEERCYYSPDNQQNWYCYKPMPGWCCLNGNVGPSTKAECTKMGGYWFLTETEALERCQPQGYCCSNYQIYITTESRCLQIGGTFYINQYEAMQRCQPTCWCCANGKVFQASQSQCTQVGGNCYTSQSQALAHCQDQTTCWCCAYGKVFQATTSQCVQSGGTCYSSYEQAQQYCRQYK